MLFTFLPKPLGEVFVEFFEAVEMEIMVNGLPMEFTVLGTMLTAKLWTFMVDLTTVILHQIFAALVQLKKPLLLLNKHCGLFMG